MSNKGIDVSKWQGKIDWAKVKAYGIQFAMLRSSFGWGEKNKDVCFEENYANAKKAGVPIGAYHYSYAKTPEEAIKEADFCLSVLKGKTFEYPIAFDMEESSVAALGKEKVSAIADAFCSRMEANGCYVMIYANLNWFQNYFTEEIFKKYDIWLAQWSSKITLNRTVGIWQTTSKGSVTGISGNVDLDIAYKDYPSIIKTAGLNGFSSVKKPENNKANTTKNDIASKSVDELAKEVRAGKYGNGETRKKALGSRWAEVQKRVEELIAEEKKATVTKPSAPPVRTGYKKGDKVTLKNAKLYSTAYDKTVDKAISGTYYIYDGVKINGRYRITNSKEKVGKEPVGQNVTGFVAL